MTDFQDKNQHWISMLEASRLCAYSQEYLSLLARRGKLFSKKFGRNWYTTREAVDDYLKTQSVFISLPKNIFGKLTSSLTPEEPEEGEPVKHAEHSKIFEEFERLNPQISFEDRKKTIPHKPVITQPEISSLQRAPSQSAKAPFVSTPVDSEDPVLKKLDTLSESLVNFAEKVTEKINRPVVIKTQSQESLTPKQKEFFDIELTSLTHRFKIFDRYARSMMRNPVRMMAIMITSIVAIFIIAGGFSFGQVDQVVQQVKKVFKDADTVQGHFPGTHANEVLVLDKAGNVSIFGHIETQGQLRSHAPDGVAPIVVDSMTLVDNLNANYLDGLASKDFTLAFVTKNGNLTYEDVFLEGNVEVGKTLTVKGATKLLDSLQVYGNLGVFGDAVFGKDIILQKGTIKISNTSLIKNLNAEFLDGIKKQNINLDFVTSNGASTGNGITIGGLEVNGQSDFRAPGFFYEGIWGSDGAFGTLGVAGDATIGDSDRPEDSHFTVYSKYFKVDASGNITASGKTTTSDLVVSTMLSDLIPSGSYDLGSSANPWNELFASNASFSNLTITGTGGGNFEGTTSSSFRINTDNITADAEDSYLTFERGTITPNAIIKWDSTNKQFNFNQPVKISSGSFEVIGTASISGDLILNGSGAASGRLQLGRAPTVPHTGTWPSFSGLDDATLLINPSTSIADGNLIAVTVGGAAKFLVDNEGDIYAGGNLILSGTTTQSTTNITGDLNVEGNTRLGDATSDKIRFVGTVLPYTLTSIPLTIKASASQTADLFRINDHNDARLLTVDFPSGLLISSSGFNFALGTSTATTSYSRLGTSTTTHSNYISKYDDLLISGDLEGRASLSFAGTASLSNTMWVSPGGYLGNVGIGTTKPTDPLVISNGTRSFSFNFGSADGDWRFYNQPGEILLQSGLSPSFTTRIRLQNTGLAIASDVAYIFLGSVDGDTGIYREAANTLGFRYGTGTQNAMTRTYATYTSTTNFERLNSGYSAANTEFLIQTEKGSVGGTARPLTLGTNGGRNLTIDTAGNVGIGTTAPTALTHIVGDTSTLFNVASGSNSRFMVLESGVVGIGTTAPTAGTKLHILNSSDNNAQIKLQATGGGGSDVSFFLTTRNSANSEGAGFDIGDVNATFFKINTAGNIGIGTYTPIAKLDVEPASTFTGPLFRVASGSNERLRVTSTGAVGIGTTTPTQLLDVLGGVRVGSGPTAGSTTMNDAGGISAADTSVTLTSVTGFPTQGMVVINENELVGYTGIAGNTLTGLTRGLYDSTASAHADGVVVRPILFTAAMEEPSVNGAGVHHSLMVYYDGIVVGGHPGTRDGRGEAAPLLKVGRPGNYVMWVDPSAITWGTDGTVTYLLGTNLGGLEAFVGTFSNHPLKIRTNNTARGTWDTAGNLLLGTETSPGSGTKSLLLADGTVPATLPSNTAGIYADDVGGTVKMFAIDEAGVTGQLGMLSGNLTAGSMLFADSTGLISQDNTNLFWDDTNNRLGIGNTSPDTKLDVSGDIMASTSAGLNTTLRLYNYSPSTPTLTDGLFSIIASGAAGIDSLRILNNTTNLVTIASSGNVGIGTTTPDLVGYGGTTLTLSKISGNAHSFIELNGVKSADSALGGIAFLNNGTRRAEIRSERIDQDTSAFLSFSTANAGSYGERMRIDKAGNVGIGTTSPKSMLHVAGDITLTGSDPSVIYASASNNNLNLYANGSININMDRNNDSTSESFRVRNNVANELFIIEETGNVGIGTTIPTATLTIRSPTATASLEFISNSEQQKTFTLRSHFQGAGANERLSILNGQGSELVSIASNGNVGIGTTNPNAKLQIEKNSTYNNELAGGIYIRSGAGGTKGLLLGADNTNSLSYIQADTVGTSFISSLALNPNGGNVGIGTTVPIYTLMVGQNTAGDNNDYSVGISRHGVLATPGTYTANTPALLISDTSGDGPASAETTALVQISAGRIADGDTNAANALLFSINNDTGSALAVKGNRTVAVGTLSSNGTVYSNSTILTNTNPSDVRLKDNIVSLGNSLEKILALRPVSYNWKSNGEAGLGFIAQEVEQVIPELVRTDDNGYKGLLTTEFIPYLTNAIQELDTKVGSQSNSFESLQTQVASLSLTVDELMARQASVSSSVTISSSGTGITDTMGAIANAVLTRVQSLWASGDVIAEGVKKTYYSVASAFNWDFDLATMVSGWMTREISISPNIDDTTRALFSGNGAQAAGESKLDLQENGAYLATYGVDSARGEIQLSGSSQLIGGEAKIFFDFSFSSVISPNIPLKVLVTPTTFIQGQIYVSDKTPYGFIVKGLNGAADGKFDWLVIARRKGFEGNDIFGVTASASSTPQPIVTTTPPSSTPTPAPSLTPETDSTPSATASGSTELIAPSTTPSPTPDVSPAPTPSPSDTPTPTPDPTLTTNPAPTTASSSATPIP